MKRIQDGLFHWNEKTYEWQRVDHTHVYKGVEIFTLTTRDIDNNNKSTHRVYVWQRKDGTEAYFTINKSGCNIEAVKELIDME